MRKLTILAALAVALLALSACSGGDHSKPASVLTLIPGNYVPLVLNETVVVGDNRFVMGLLHAEDNTPAVGAKMHLRFFQLNADNTAGPLKFEKDAEAITITKSYTDRHADGTVEQHKAGETGAYVAQATFDAAGNWGVEVTGTDPNGKALDTVHLGFPVEATDPGIAIGSKIPASQQKTLRDVTDIHDIDTSVTPIPAQHDKTVAEAIANGKPTVIAFATPAYCTSQICGPTKDIFDAVYEVYRDRVNFVHIEPYDVPKMAAGQCPNLGDCAVQAGADFKLHSEPWVFVADSQGILRAKFDGIVSEDELKAAVEAVLTPAAS
jgi:hypothetical protein